MAKEAGMMAAGRCSEIEALLDSLPFGPGPAVPTLQPNAEASWQASVRQAGFHTNYLLAAILLELREIKAAVIPQARVG